MDPRSPQNLGLHSTGPIPFSQKRKKKEKEKEKKKTNTLVLTKCINFQLDL
jgi:hypothetical protein